MTTNKLMKKGMRDLMRNKPIVKEINPDLKEFADKINKKKTGKKAGGIMKKKGMAKGGMTKKGMAAGGPVLDAEKQSLMDAIAKVKKKKKPKTDRQLMQMKGGGMAKKGYAMGGVMKKKGMKKGGKVRGAGIVSKGVRPAKMVKMSKGKAKGGKRR